MSKRLSDLDETVYRQLQQNREAWLPIAFCGDSETRKHELLAQLRKQHRDDQSCGAATPDAPPTDFP